MPFLQLHRQEPEHNMYTLDSAVAPIYLRLRAITTDAATADRIVRGVEHNLESAMSRMSSAVVKGHVPSRSVPLARMPRMLLARHRENTL
jgi:hypothetical protein